MAKLTVFGHTGFVGGKFVEKYKLKHDMHLPERYSRRTADDSEQTINFVSTIDNYNVFTDATLDVTTNLVTLMEMLQSWRLNNPNAIFNFISSWFVYGAGWDVPTPERAECYPKGFYSITKKAAEDLLVSYCETFNLKYRILRLGNVVGSGDKKVSAKKNALQYMINKMKNNEEIEVYGDGKFYRNFIHVSDCAAAIECVITRGKVNEIYNIGIEEHMEFIKLLEYTAFLIDYKIPFKYIEPKEFHKKVQTKSFRLDTKKLYELGFQPEYFNGYQIIKQLVYH